MKNFYTLFFLICLSTLVFSQKKKAIIEKNGYTISIATKNLKDEKIILFLKYGINKQMIITDSAVVKTVDEVIELKSEKKIVGGIYFLKFESQKNQIMLAIDNDSNIDLSIDNTNIESITCSKNKLNKDFLNFQVNEKKLDKTQNNEERKKLAILYPKSVLNLFFTIENKISEKNPTILSEQIAYRDSFFKNINKNDKRLFLLPNVNRMLYSFVISTPIDNEYYKQNIKLLLNGLDCNSKNYGVYLKWFVSNLNYFENKNLEATFIYLYKTYIDNDKCKIFNDKEIATNSNKYYSILKVPKESIIPDFNFIDKDSTSYSFSKIYQENDYTFISFYSPSCEHCEKTIPKVKLSMEEFQKKYNKKIQMVSVLNDTDTSMWEKFIENSKISSWINLKSIDPEKKYQQDLNTFSNPTFFFVDKKGKILLKSFNTEAIEEILKYSL